MSSWPDLCHCTIVVGPEHTEGYTIIKKEIIQALVLKYYDLKKLSVLQTEDQVHACYNANIQST